MSAPGICHLLQPIEDAERTKHAAENSLSVLHDGIASIGYLLWHVGAESKEPIDPFHLAGAGWLLHSLGEQCTQLAMIESNARYELGLKEKAAVGAAASV